MLAAADRLPCPDEEQKERFRDAKQNVTTKAGEVKSELRQRAADLEVRIQSSSNSNLCLRSPSVSSARVFSNQICRLKHNRLN